MGVMDERSSRIFVGLCLLVLLWIGTYWLYEPGRPASGADVRFADRGSALIDPEPVEAGSAAVADDPALSFELPAEQRRDESGVELGVVVVPPKFFDYIVKDGETFKSIARDRLGDVGLWTAVARSNPLRDPRRLRAGDVIRLPVDPGNIQGVLVSASDGEPLDAGATEPGQDPWVEYTVKRGDSLSGISKAYYGSSRHADAIFDANRDQLSSPDALRIGQVLLLPPITTDE
jgi:nucleoid-associated protein YgaU